MAITTVTKADPSVENSPYNVLIDGELVAEVWRGRYWEWTFRSIDRSITLSGFRKRRVAVEVGLNALRQKAA